MPCTRPIKAGFDQAGQISFSKRKWSKELVPFELPCRKCVHCRLETAREKAIRCFHHAQFYEGKNIFLTLTYDEENLESPRLIYRHWQNFMKALRSDVGSHPDDRISVMVTGEYGEKRKRPHWHAILFNYRPEDESPARRTELGHSVYESQKLNELWGRGLTEYGDVTLESASYVARYSAKKLVHGSDNEHEFHPIHRTSSKNAIGLPWIQKYWRQTFQNGYVVLPNGRRAGIPRFYEDWFREHHPSAWMEYASTVKLEIQKKMGSLRDREAFLYDQALNEAKKFHSPNPLTQNQIKEFIQKEKHKNALKGLKL